jgi:hypothetical protein
MLCIHVVTLLAMWMTLMAWQINTAIFLLVAIHFYWVLYKHGVRVPYSNLLFGDRYFRFVWGSDDDWQLTESDGSKYEACILGSSYVHRRLLVLNFRISCKPWYSRYQTLVLFPDSVDSDSFRRLCVRLQLVRGRYAENSLA